MLCLSLLKLVLPLTRSTQAITFFNFTFTFFNDLIDDAHGQIYLCWSSELSMLSLSIFLFRLTLAFKVSTFTFLKSLALAQIDPGWSELSMFALRELHFTRLSLLQVAKRQKTKDNEKQKDKMFALKELHFTRLSLLKVANVNIFVVHPTISSHFQAFMFYFFSRRNKGQDVLVLRSTV